MVIHMYDEGSPPAPPRRRACHGTHPHDPCTRSCQPPAHTPHLLWHITSPSYSETNFRLYTSYIDSHLRGASLPHHTHRNTSHNTPQRNPQHITPHHITSRNVTQHITRNASHHHITREDFWPLYTSYITRLDWFSKGITLHPNPKNEKNFSPFL